MKFPFTIIATIVVLWFPECYPFVGLECRRQRFSQRRKLSESTALSLGYEEENSSNDVDSRSVARQDRSTEDYVVEVQDPQRRQTLINAIAGGLLLSTAVASAQFYVAQAYTPDGFRRISPIQFIAALGDPKANSGTGAQDWGIWVNDPGPRGVWLRDYEKVLLNSRDHEAPAGWTFDSNDWWLEEHGLIMEAPKFPVIPGRYLVTGGRVVTTGLTIEKDGSWKLDGDASLYDVTHLPCRSARYRPNSGGGSPLTAKQSDFPVLPGAEMPNVAGCDKRDYAVLFVVGKAA